MNRGDGGRLEGERRDGRLGISAMRRGYIRDKLRTDRFFFLSNVTSLSQTIRSRACRECGAGTLRYESRRRRTVGGREKRRTTGD
jgi:hypothetical protein